MHIYFVREKKLPEYLPHSDYYNLVAEARYNKKSCIQKALNLLMCADNCNNAKKNQKKGEKKYNMSHVICHLSTVICHLPCLAHFLR